MSYEHFRDVIRRTLRREKRPMTWTEIRTKARLPQLFPNNGWVRKLESDVALTRERDTHGIIHWRLA